MARDCSRFKDVDGTAYFIAAGRDNADLFFYRLTEDYLGIDECVKQAFCDQYREAPTVLKRNGVYFMLSSECMGAEPNQGMVSWTRDFEHGRWSHPQPLGSPTTYDSQPAFVFSLPTPDGEQFFYVGDRWNPSDFYKFARYVVLPITFEDDTTLKLDWVDEFTFDTETGAIETKVKPTGLHRLKFRAHESIGGYLFPDGEDGKLCLRRLDYREDGLIYAVDEGENGFVRIRHVHSGKYLTKTITTKLRILSSSSITRIFFIYFKAPSVILC